MTVSGYDMITVESENITADLIVWKRYRIPAYGILEAMLDANPHLARLHKTSPFLPVGTQVRIPIDLGILKGSPQPKTTIMLWGTDKYKDSVEIGASTA
jgi:phage tail protein X